MSGAPSNRRRRSQAGERTSGPKIRSNHMTTVTVCVGSSCHVKGSRSLIAAFVRLMKELGREDQVELKGAFCMERCGQGVNWHLGDRTITSSSAEEAVKVLREWLVARADGAAKAAVYSPKTEP